MTDRPMPFPPPPRSWRGLVDAVLADLARTDPLDWEPIGVAGLDAAWVGVSVPSWHDIDRPWIWDIVTPTDHERDRLLSRDPLTIAVAQNTVLVELSRDDDPSASVAMQVPVSSMPMRIDVPANVLPDPPWRVELSTCWTSGSIAAALGDWMQQWYGHRVPIAEHSTAEAGDDDQYDLGDGLFTCGSAFERLLHRPADEAAVVTATMRAMVDVLAPFR